MENGRNCTKTARKFYGNSRTSEWWSGWMVERRPGGLGWGVETVKLWNGKLVEDNGAVGWSKELKTVGEWYLKVFQVNNTFGILRPHIRAVRGVLRFTSTSFHRHRPRKFCEILFLSRTERTVWQVTIYSKVLHTITHHIHQVKCQRTILSRSVGIEPNRIEQKKKMKQFPFGRKCCCRSTYPQVIVVSRT